MSEDPLHSFLFSNNIEPLDEPPMSEEQLRENLHYLNGSLMSQGFPSLGEMFQPDLQSIKQTMDCIYAILQARQKDLSFRSRTQEFFDKAKADNQVLNRRIELQNDEKERMSKEMGSLQN